MSPEKPPFSRSFVFPRLTSPLAGKVVALLILAGLGPWTARSSAADLIFATFPFSVRADETSDAFGGTLVTPRYFHSATSLPDGRVLLVGGYATGGATVSCETYDPATNVWSATASINPARYDHRAVGLADGRVLIMGGLDNFGANTLASAQLYDPTTASWAPAASMITARVAFQPILLPDGKVLVAGGKGPLSQITALCEIYDPVTDTWTPTGSLSHARKFYGATLLANGKVLIAGGDDQRATVPESELYDPMTGTWTDNGPISVPRLYHAQLALADGRVLIAGGYIRRGGRKKPTASAELCDPATGIWSTTASLAASRVNFTANLLNNGRVLVAGGSRRGGSAALDSIEEYDPVTEIWQTSTMTLDTPRQFHTASSLPDGSIILAGGSASGFLLPDADLIVTPQ